MSFSYLQLAKNMSSRFNKIYEYMTSFETIDLDTYKKLVANEKKIFDLSQNFTTPEILNNYRHSDKNIDNKIKENEKKIEKYKKIDNIINKNIEKFKKEDTNILPKTENFNSYIKNYKFDNDEEILDSFEKIFKEYDMEYNPRQNTKYYRIRYFLNKLKENRNIPVDLYNHFHARLSENNKTYHIIPIEKAENIQSGSSINNIVINNEDLNNGILRVRYLNNRKLNNNVLNKDYKITKNMVNAIKYNKDIHKLSKSEMKVYHELQKILNKEQDINVLIGSYLSGNNSKKLYNKISSMLYYKLKNGLISKKEYTKLITEINKI